MNLELHGIWWLWWMLGTFGLVGTAILVWIAPTLFLQVARMILTFFITNRIGNIIAAAAIAFFVGDVNRSIYDRHEYAAKTAAFEQAQKERDAQIAEQTREEVTKQIAVSAASAAEIDNQVKEFNNAIPPTIGPAVNPFRVGDDSCKLRALAGQSGCGPESRQGVPKPRAPAAVVQHHKRNGLSRAFRRVIGRDQKGTDGNKGS